MFATVAFLNFSGFRTCGRVREPESARVGRFRVHSAFSGMGMMLEAFSEQRNTLSFFPRADLLRQSVRILLRLEGLAGNLREPLGPSRAVLWNPHCIAPGTEKLVHRVASIALESSRKCTLPAPPVTLART